jgi:hypothetical protein
MQSEITDGLDFCTIKPVLKLHMERLKVDKRTIHRLFAGDPIFPIHLALTLVFAAGSGLCGVDKCRFTDFSALKHALST